MTTKHEARLALHANERAQAHNAIRPTLRGCALLAIAHGVRRAEFVEIAGAALDEVYAELQRSKPRWLRAPALPKPRKRARRHK
jgi:hypothetical protein